MHNIVIDLSNIVFATRHAKVQDAKSVRQKQPDIDLFIFKETLETIINTAHKFEATGVIIAADSKTGNWRKGIYPEYKGTRDKSDFYFEDTVRAGNMVYEFLRDNTAATCLQVSGAEADDIIAVWTQLTNVDTTIISSDTDFVQLIKSNVKLYAPAQKKYRESEDPAYDLFLKCIRGDTGDNIRSAYPRVRETKLKEAYTDPLKMLNIMETIVGETKVGEVYAFNKSLIDLTLQPQEIRDAIIRSIDEYISGKYSELGVMKKINDIGLVRFTEMFKGKDKAFKRKPPLTTLV